MSEKPRVVCLCGSTRFKDAYLRAQRAETLAGRIVLSVGLFGHEEGIDMSGPVKQMLDELHLRKIDLADEVLVIDAETAVCSNCGKACETLPFEVFPLLSRCCRTAAPQRPYVGESTRREIAYAEAHGKPVRYLSREKGAS